MLSAKWQKFCPSPNELTVFIFQILLGYQYICILYTLWIALYFLLFSWVISFEFINRGLLA